MIVIMLRIVILALMISMIAGLPQNVPRVKIRLSKMSKSQNIDPTFINSGSLNLGL